MRKPTLADYKLAIDNLLSASKQLEPDGFSCSVCGDNGHQAWQCHHNPLSPAYNYFGEGSYWKCFHCNQIFKDFEEASKHFGERESTTPICRQL